ncbi:hypothetical protein HanPI659440_Chr01g0022011 [Helianthus annuus]|nr:hypothetical protein HanPI659440_Chr01g0022011 [Helianthus annuus]
MCGIPATSWIASKIPRVLWRLWNSLAAAVVAAVQLRRGDVSGGIGAAVLGRRCNWVWLTNLGQMLYLPSKPRIIMPPRMRGRGGFATSHDHEAGPSHRRAPSASHNIAANDLWRSFAKPARHSVSASTSPSLPQSFGPHSENGPHGSYIPLHQSPHHYPAPAYQGLYNPDAFLDEPVVITH